jgi:hypothetical protein
MVVLKSNENERANQKFLGELTKTFLRGVTQ